MTKKKSPDVRDTSILISLRLPAPLVQALDEHVERLQGRMPGVTFTRVDAVKVLLTAALAAETGS